jgi:hypothetical protein
MNDYQQQAIDFLKATETTFTSTYKDHDYYFPDDTETRDIYNVVLKNKAHRYRFTFGQSIANAGKHPTAYQVLSCLQKYDVGTFDNFCSDFGLFPINSSEELRKAKKTYKAVLREWKNVELLFTTDQLEMLQAID